MVSLKCLFCWPFPCLLLQVTCSAKATPPNALFACPALCLDGCLPDWLLYLWSLVRFLPHLLALPALRLLRWARFCFPRWRKQDTLKNSTWDWSHQQAVWAYYLRHHYL